MPQALTEEELVEFQMLFNLVDTDQGGSIGVEELGSLMDVPAGCLGVDGLASQLFRISYCTRDGTGRETHTRKKCRVLT